MQGDLLLSRGESPSPRLKRVQALDENRLLLAFDREVDPLDSVIEIDGLEVSAFYSSARDRSRLYVLTGPQQAGASYRFAKLVIEKQPVSWDQPWRASTRKDKKAPSVVSASPSKVGAPGDSLAIEFDEAMATDTPAGDFWIETDSTASVDGTWKWESPTRLVLIPREPLRPGHYSLRGRLGQLSDRAGHAPADSLAELDFEVAPDSELPSLSGTVTADSLLDLSEVMVLARGVPAGRTYIADCDSSGAFSLAKVLPGKYSVMAFADLNGNLAADAGTPHPFTPAEAVSISAEMVAVRRGQTAEGVDLEFR